MQWRRFRRLVLGTTGIVWILCCSGILLLTEANLIPRLALLAMLVLCSIVSLYLSWIAYREIRRLKRQTSEMWA